MLLGLLAKIKWNIRNLFYLNSRGQKSQISFTGPKSGVSRAILFLETLGENLFIVSSSFWWLLVFFGLWPHHYNLCLYDQISFSSFVCDICLCLPFVSNLWLYLRSIQIIQDNLPHIKILTLITSAIFCIFFLFFAYKVTVTGIWIWTSFEGPLVSLPHNPMTVNYSLNYLTEDKTLSLNSLSSHSLSNCTPNHLPIPNSISNLPSNSSRLYS